MKTTLKPPKSFFNWCYSKIPTYKWENKKRTILSSNRENCPLIVKRLTVNSRLSFPIGTYFFAVILVTKKRIEIQSYVFWADIEEGRESIEYRLCNLERFCEGEHIKAHTWGDGWYEGLLRNYGYLSGPYTNTQFYPNNWEKKVTKFNEFKYLKIGYIDRYTIPIYQKYASEIGFLQSINAHELAKEIVKPNYRFSNGKWGKSIDMRVCNKKWLKKHKHILKNTNKVFNDVEIETYLRKRKTKIVDGIGKYMTVSDFEHVPKRAGLMRFQRWIVSNEIKFEKYKDYLNMLLELEIPMNSDLVAMPRDFQKKHDELAEIITKMKLENREEYLKLPIRSCQEYEMEIGDVAFVAPKNLKDIVQEGNELSHCVSGERYLDEHKKGNTTIMFIRNKNDIATPLYTLEYKNGKIVQVQGKSNKRTPPPKINDAANKWVEKVKRKKGA